MQEPEMYSPHASCGPYYPVSVVYGCSFLLGNINCFCSLMALLLECFSCAIITEHMSYICHMFLDRRSRHLMPHKLPVCDV